MPGDKSISHRAAMIAALADGACRISNFSKSEDCAATLSCLAELGVGIHSEKSEVIVKGVGLRGFKRPVKKLDCRNSGTTMRLVAGVLAGQDFRVTLTGDESLRARPMQRIVEPLEMMGAKISSADGRAPLTIQGTSSLRGIEYELLVASAQVKSAILLAGLNAIGPTKVIEVEPTRDHTERMLAAFGAKIELGVDKAEGENSRFAVVEGRAHLGSQNISVPGDISSAAYFAAAAALLPGSALDIADVGLNATRTEFLTQFQSMGVEIQITHDRIENNEPRGVIRITGNRQPTHHGSEVRATIDGLLIPKVIDELPLLAVVGSQIEGGIEIRNAAELRVKESDRIATTAANLRAMGAEVEEFDDGLRVDGPVRLHGASIDPAGDHRIAMSFAVAALIAEGETEIRNADCVAVSFPGFFDLLNAVVVS